MRHLTSISDESDARRFGDYLAAVGIGNTVEQASSGWSIWINDDDDLERARIELQQFTANPRDVKYQGAGKVAKAQRTRDEKRQQKLRRNFVDVRTSWAKQSWTTPPLTLTLIVICLIVAALTGLGMGFYGDRVIESLSFASTVNRPPDIRATRERIRRRLEELQQRQPQLTPEQLQREMENNPGFNPEYETEPDRLEPLTHGEIRRGQVWRLITPIFLHFGPFHLLFNLFWLRDLGSAIERRKGWPMLLGLALASAIVGNIAQAIASGPAFGGMSGVVYALFGYVWMKGKFEPWDGLGLLPGTVAAMLFWLVICYSGFVGDIANSAHVAGLIVGALTGGAKGWISRTRRRMKWR